MKRHGYVVQRTIVGMWLGVALFNSATVWATDSENVGTTQRFRGVEQEHRAVPQVTAKQAAPGTSLRFAAESPASEAPKNLTAPAGSTMRFASPMSRGADQPLRQGMVDVKENGEEIGEERGTFN